jgi:hypothetical protein
MVRDIRDPPPVPLANAVRESGERIAELLAANNAEVERRRKAEARLVDCRSALAFYADPKSWRANGHPQMDADTAPILKDRGARAGAAISALGD